MTDSIPTPPPKAEPPILLTPEPPPAPTPEKTLFKAGMTVEEAKAAALKELADKPNPAPVEEPKEPPKEAPKAPEKAPETPKPEYTLQLPENSPLTKEDLDGLLKEAKESGLTEEQAKAALQETDAVARTAQKRLLDKQTDEIKRLPEVWKEAVKKDPEIGGEKLAETAIKASRAFKAVASPALTEFLVKTGYIEHPELIRMMVKVHDTFMGEDRFVPGGRDPNPRTAPRTLEEKAKKLFSNPITEQVLAPK